MAENLHQFEGGAWLPDSVQEGHMAVTATATAAPATTNCPPLDCYQQCQEQDKERYKACVELNKAHIEEMKKHGCPGTTCKTKNFSKTCRKRKSTKKTTCKKSKKKTATTCKKTVKKTTKKKNCGCK